MEKTFKVLVENFDIRELKYEFGKQVITKLTLTSLKELLEKLPFDETVLIPPRIITDKLIIRRKSYNSYFYLYNDNSSFFRNKKRHIYEKIEDQTFELTEFDDFFKIKKKSFLKKLTTVLESLLDRFWLLYFITNMYFFIELLIQELNNQNANIVFLIFLIWIIIFCIYSFSYGIIKVINLKRKPQGIKLDYSIPFINSFKTIDISEPIVLFGQLILSGFTIIYDTILSVNDFFMLSLIILLLIIVLLTFGSDYYFTGRHKDLYYQTLLSTINNHLEGEERHYYLQVAIKLKEKPLISSDKIPKFITFFSILLTFIPLISYLFVYR